MTHDLLSWLLPSILIGTALSAVPLVLCLGLWRSGRRARGRLREAGETAALVTRTLRLFAGELDGMAHTLRGHSGLLAAERHAAAPELAVLAGQLGSLADEMSHHLIPAAGRQALECECIALVALVADAVARLQATISPGRRHWRIGGLGAQDVSIWADRRALLLILVRVLGEAARSSLQDDWVEIGWAVTPSGLVIRIEDEGAGMASSEVMKPEAVDSRGTGVRLALARRLVQAHGGTLSVEGLARVGTRVTITLPRERLRETMKAGGLSMAGAFAAAHHIIPAD